MEQFFDCKVKYIQKVFSAVVVVLNCKASRRVKWSNAFKHTLI